MDVWISIGSNLASKIGPPEETIRCALAELKSLSCSGFKVSSLFLSAPVDCRPGSPDFLNAMVRMDVPERISPENFLMSLQAVEKQFGRVRGNGKNAARTLDLDMICWGRLILDSPQLRLPHPRAHQRAFVLLPMVEIDPLFRLPGFDKTIGQQLASLSDAAGLERLIP
ncbi:MAG: 2-amino-4-hydroxy-6-hydroxymethyldihydropteridine diphosphokinase [Gammaproteobacteria bacterium]|nr:2-amino-4-hydroxy-6-hydroxymethyldihydropteridine diphosphokinase [Gammaproteobacteria bacterium]